MLTEILKGKVNVISEVSDWEEAVKLSARPLLEENFISEDYIESMISNIRKNGSYIIITPGVAMPHSRPEDGVKKTGLSLLKLNKSITFPKNNEVKLIFTLAAKDSNSHIDMITELCDLLADSKKIASLNETKSQEEVISII